MKECGEDTGIKALQDPVIFQGRREMLINSRLMTTIREFFCQ